MPPKKKAAISGYAIYVRELRETYKKSGRHFPKNNQDAFNFVKPLWEKMSDAEKKVYNDRAKEEKALISADPNAMFNAQGVSYAEIQRAHKEKEEARDLMINTIIRVTTCTDFNTKFLEQKFYLCHVNYYYSNNNDIFKPAEIALCEFNLKQGVLRRFHSFIDSGPIETGYRYEAKQHTEETHNIPFEDPNWVAENDYASLFHQIRKFVCGDDPYNFPPFYAMSDDVRKNYAVAAVKGTLDTLCDAADESTGLIMVFDLPTLYHHLRVRAVSESSDPDLAAVAKFFSLSMAKSDLEKDKFCYSKDISCDFHEDKDLGIFCSLSIVTRLVYSMCDFLLSYIDIPIVKGGHCPKGSAISKTVDDRGEESKHSARSQPQKPQEVSVRATNGKPSNEPFPSLGNFASTLDDVVKIERSGGEDLNISFSSQSSVSQTSSHPPSDCDNVDDDRASGYFGSDELSQPLSQTNAMEGRVYGRGRAAAWTKVESKRLPAGRGPRLNTNK